MEMDQDVYNNSVLSGEEVKYTASDPKVAESLIALFPTLTPSELADYSNIMSFLSDNTRFNNVARNIVDPMVIRNQDNSNQPIKGEVLQGDVKMMQLMYKCFSEEKEGVPKSGFEPAPPVYMTGTSTEEEFKTITSNKLLFVDGLSTIHGEHAHSLQWLNIYAATMDAKTPLQLNHPVADLYAKAANIKQDKSYSLTKEQNDQDLKKKGVPATTNQSTVWEYVVDGIPQVDASTRHVRPDHTPSGDELKNASAFSIVSNQARSPAVVQHKYIFGDLNDTAVGTSLRSMYQNRPVMTQKGKDFTRTDTRWLMPDDKIKEEMESKMTKGAKAWGAPFESFIYKDTGVTGEGSSERVGRPGFWTVMKKSGQDVQSQYRMQAKSYLNPKGDTTGRVIWVDPGAEDTNTLKARKTLEIGWETQKAKRLEEQRKQQSKDIKSKEETRTRTKPSEEEIAKRQQEKKQARGLANKEQLQDPSLS